jgi:hypothetical protein
MTYKQLIEFIAWLNNQGYEVCWPETRTIEIELTATAKIVERRTVYLPVHEYITRSLIGKYTGEDA